MLCHSYILNKQVNLPIKQKNFFFFAVYKYIIIFAIQFVYSFINLEIRKIIMGRIKGSRMTEEAKAAMRAKREANKLGKESAFNLVATNLKLLTFEDLENTIGLALRYKKEKMGEEELRLIKEKEEIELKLQRLKEADKKFNL